MSTIQYSIVAASNWLQVFITNTLHDIWQLLKAVWEVGIPSIWFAVLNVLTFLKIGAAELYAFVTADTCDGTVAALFFGTACVYLLLRKRNDQGERAASVKDPPIKISPALAGQAFWDKYDAAPAWKSSICADKTCHLQGGRLQNSRPMDTLLPRREYIPKKRRWEGSGTANSEGVRALLLPRETAESADALRASEMQQSAEYGEVQDAVQVVDWSKTREMAVAAAEVWSTKMPYDEWILTYNTNFKHAGSLAAAGMLLDPLGARQGLLEVNRQFYRDVTSGGIIQLHARALPDRGAMEAAIKRAKKQLKTRGISDKSPALDISEEYEHHIARFAWDGLVRCVDGDVLLAHEVAAVANQNLGIVCYEYLVNHFAHVDPAALASKEATGSALAVLQTGEHFVNISREEQASTGKGAVVKVRFEGLFKLVPFAVLEGISSAAELDASQVRAVAATAELCLALPVSRSGPGGPEKDDILEEEEDALEDNCFLLSSSSSSRRSARFAIHIPVKPVVGPAAPSPPPPPPDAELWLREWLEVLLGIPPRTPATPATASLLGRGVVITGLAASSTLNGRTGTVVSFDDDRGRYSVALDTERQGGVETFMLAIKPCNLRETHPRRGEELEATLLDSKRLAVAGAQEQAIVLGSCVARTEGAQERGIEGAEGRGIPRGGGGVTRTEEREGSSEDARELQQFVSDGEAADETRASTAWTSGKERLLGRLMGEGFSREAALRAIIAVEHAREGVAQGREQRAHSPAAATAEVVSASHAAATAAATVVVSSSDAGGGAESAVQKRTTVPVSKSTAKVMECILWLCERLGDASINAPLSEAEFEQLSIGPQLPGWCALGASPGAQQQRAATHDETGLATPATPATPATATPANESWLGRKVVITGLAASNMLNGRTGTIASVDVDGRYSVALDTETRGVVETFLVTINATNLQAVVAPAALPTDPWKVLEKASEAAAEAAAKRIRQEAVEKRKLTNQDLRGFRRGYKS